MRSPDRIRKETDDVIILDNLLGLLGFLIFAAFFGGIFLNTVGTILSIFFSFTILVLVIFLAYETVIIDKKIQIVTIKNNFNIVKKLPFSNISCIEIKDVSDLELTAWKINIDTIQGGSIEIYNINGLFPTISDAKRVAEKVSRITSKQISYSRQGDSHQLDDRLQFRWQ